MLLRTRYPDEGAWYLAMSMLGGEVSRVPGSRCGHLRPALLNCAYQVIGHPRRGRRLAYPHLPMGLRHAPFTQLFALGQVNSIPHRF
jgi:hypothetical protein